MTGSGLAFWLSYVESRGGLWESAGDAAIVMIPPPLQHRLELPEEFTVTEHPDVAREDGVALLTAGHPLLTASDEDVLAADDAGILCRVASPPRSLRMTTACWPGPVTGSPSSTAGSMPAKGRRRLRQVLRVGVLVTYTASADEVFHERAECWLDVPSRQELPEQAVRGMRRFIADGPAAGRRIRISPPLLPAAVAQAHRLLRPEIFRTVAAIAGGWAQEAFAEAELARAKVLGRSTGLAARRQASAAPDRQALLAARADSVRAEEQRRLAEIEEKYACRHEIRPYRLHLLQVPVLRLPVDVLRGTRRFPLTLDWMLPAGAFAPVSCPGCGADTARWPLAAARRCWAARAAWPGPRRSPLPRRRLA